MKITGEARLLRGGEDGAVFEGTKSCVNTLHGRIGYESVCLEPEQGGCTCQWSPEMIFSDFR